MLATGGFEKKLRIFDLSRASSSDASLPVNGTSSSTTSSELGPGVHEGIIKSIVWGADINIMITAADDSFVRWWDLRARKPITSFQLEGQLGTCELNNLPASQYLGNSVLSVAAGKKAYFFDGGSPGQLIKTVPTAHDIASVALNLEARKFVVGGNSDTWVRVYSFDSERELDVHKGHHGPVWSTNFSPDGRLYATGSEDGTIKLWKFCQDPYGLWK